MNYRFFLIILSLNTLVFSQNKATYTYAIKGSDTLKMDVYTPKKLKANDSLPVILWMHGGGFIGGKRDNLPEVKMMEFLTQNGFIGISISYRLLRKDKSTGFGCACPKSEKLETFKQAAIDYLDAAKYLINNKSILNIDRTKIIAGGSSAGAEAVLNAVYMKPYFLNDLEKYKTVKFSGVFSLAGALVNVEYINEKNALPTVLFHGTEDNLVPYGSAPHHRCSEEKPGYLILDGSDTIAKKLDDLKVAYYFNQVIGGRHEISSIPFDELSSVLSFFKSTSFNSEIIQTKKIKIKNP